MFLPLGGSAQVVFEGWHETGRDPVLRHEFFAITLDEEGGLTALVDHLEESSFEGRAPREGQHWLWLGRTRTMVAVLRQPDDALGTTLPTGFRDRLIACVDRESGCPDPVDVVLSVGPTGG